MSYVSIKNLVEHKSTIDTFNYIKKYDNPIHYLYIKTKSKEWSNIQFKLSLFKFDENDELIISTSTHKDTLNDLSKGLPKDTLNDLSKDLHKDLPKGLPITVKCSKNPFTINACIKKHHYLKIQINTR